MKTCITANSQTLTVALSGPVARLRLANDFLNERRLG